MNRHHPNTALRALLEESGWTHEQLAQAVNGIAKEGDVDLRYDRTAVAHWLAGVSPRPLTRGYLLEAFRRKLRRYVALGETGLAPPPGAVPPDTGVIRSDQEGAVVLRQLCGAILDEQRRSQTLGQPYRGDPWFFLPANGAGSRPTPQSAAPAPDDPRLSVIDKAAAVFGSGLLVHGGAFATVTCATFLAERVVPYLEAEPGRGAHLAAGAAQLTHLLGDMYADDLRHGVAQQCYRVSARLASATPGSTEVLLVAARAGLHAQELAVDSMAQALVRTATQLAREDASPAAHAAVLVGSAARDAASGRRDAARCSLRLAESVMHRAWAGQKHFNPVEATLFAVALRDWGKAHATLGDQIRAGHVWQLALRHVPSRHVYVRALLHAELGALLIQLGDWQRACVVWEAFVGIYPALDSRRAGRALAGLEEALRRTPRQPDARALRARVRALRASGVRQDPDRAPPRKAAARFPSSPPSRGATALGDLPLQRDTARHTATETPVR